MSTKEQVLAFVKAEHLKIETMIESLDVAQQPPVEPPVEPPKPPVVGADFVHMFHPDITEGGRYFMSAKDRNRFRAIEIGGRKGLACITQPGDNNVSSSGSAERADWNLGVASYVDERRAELTGAFHGKEQWWAHSIYLPADNSVVPSYKMPPTNKGYQWQVLMQFHFAELSSGPKAKPGNLQPQFVIEIVANPGGGIVGPVFRARGYGGDTLNGGRHQMNLSDGPPKLGVWYDFIHQIKWSWNSDGRHNLWMREGNAEFGLPKWQFSGPTLYLGYAGYLKLSNYHSHAPGAASSVVHARVARGSSMAAVAP